MMREGFETKDRNAVFEKRKVGAEVGVGWKGWGELQGRRRCSRQREGQGQGAGVGRPAGRLGVFCPCCR